MRSGKFSTLIGIGMIIGGVPCTFVSVLLWQLTLGLQEGRAAGRDVGFDAIGVGFMMYFAFLIALGTCVAGLLYFAYTVLKSKVALKAWHRIAIGYSLIQVTVVVIYLVTQ
jgi:hypothetical protein